MITFRLESCFVCSSCVQSVTTGISWCAVGIYFHGISLVQNLQFIGYNYTVVVLIASI